MKQNLVDFSRSVNQISFEHLIDKGQFKLNKIDKWWICSQEEGQKMSWSNTATEKEAREKYDSYH